MKKVGIEKINIYGSSLCMSQEALARARGRDPERVLNDFHIATRSLNPPYEDTVTMGANAAIGMLSEEDKQSIGLLIAGTEGSVDFGKPISTNIHRALGCRPTCATSRPSMPATARSRPGLRHQLGRLRPQPRQEGAGDRGRFQPQALPQGPRVRPRGERGRHPGERHAQSR